MGSLFFFIKIFKKFLKLRHKKVFLISRITGTLRERKKQPLYRETVTHPMPRIMEHRLNFIAKIFSERRLLYGKVRV